MYDFLELDFIFSKVVPFDSMYNFQIILHFARFDRELVYGKIVASDVYPVNIAFFAYEKVNEEFSNEPLFRKKIEFKNSFISMKCNFFFFFFFTFSIFHSSSTFARTKEFCLVHRTKKFLPVFIYIYYLIGKIINLFLLRYVHIFCVRSLFSSMRSSIKIFRVNCTVTRFHRHESRDTGGENTFLLTRERCSYNGLVVKCR